MRGCSGHVLVRQGRRYGDAIASVAVVCGVLLVTSTRADSAARLLLLAQRRWACPQAYSRGGWDDGGPARAAAGSGIGCVA
jgi:hypothetical protein